MISREELQFQIETANKQFHTTRHAVEESKARIQELTDLRIYSLDDRPIDKEVKKLAKLERTYEIERERLWTLGVLDRVFDLGITYPTRATRGEE